MTTRLDILDFAGKRVLVVGGSSGIGNGIAHAFKDRGAQVHVWGTRPSRADYQDTRTSDLDGLDYMQVDVGNFEALQRLALPFDTLDVAVLSQGAVLYGREEFTLQGFQRVVNINLNSLMACAQKLHDCLAASKGALIIISSAGAFRSTIGNPAYCASKTGAVGLTKTLGQAWAREGIRVNGIAPGLVDTRLTQVTVANADRLAARLKNIPAGRLGTVEEMGNVALFLGSPMSQYIIGQTIVVDGGRTL
jgi:3-oxoacyl-[acyl-carrier protein] reductase